MKYDNPFKLEALKLSDEIGVRKAADQLGIPYYTLADWRTIRKNKGESAFVGSGNRREPLDEKDRKIQKLENQEKENLIKQDFSSETPFKKLLTDISQIQCIDGKLYISPALDCFDGSVLSLVMRDNMKKELCIDTVKAAAQRYPQIRGAIYHSDRGSQYTSEEFRNTLKSLGITQSLSGVDCCYDNARMESFFATLKKELL